MLLICLSKCCVTYDKIGWTSLPNLKSFEMAFSLSDGIIFFRNHFHYLLLKYKLN